MLFQKNSYNNKPPKTHLSYDKNIQISNSIPYKFRIKEICKNLPSIINELPTKPNDL